MIVLIPIFSDGFLHPSHKDNDLSLLYIRHWGDLEGRIICLSHPDCGDRESIDDIKNDQANFYLTPDKKKLMNIFPDTRLIDVNYMNWWKTNKPMNLEDIRINSYDFFNNKYYNMKNVNQIIPLVKHKEYCDKVFDKMQEVVSSVYDTPYNSEAIDAYNFIEKNGVKVSDDILDIFDHRVKRHISDGKLYSNYFLWTSTGRPSNSFGSVNFAALNKEQRKGFIPEHDMLVEYDYDAYHLRLIADLIDYKFPKGSVHEYLASFYGSTYEESKSISFRLLYGGIDKDIAKSIPFFGKVQHFIDEKWSEFNKNNYVKTNIYSRRIHKDNMSDVNKNKLFNYIIQAHETETNIKTIIDLKHYLLNRKSKLVLYGYDSFLFDIHKDDRVQVFRELKQILERNGNLVKAKAGKNYGEMVNITEKI
jgi:hypothetical protein